MSVVLPRQELQRVLRQVLLLGQALQWVLVAKVVPRRFQVLQPLCVEDVFVMDVLVVGDRSIVDVAKYNFVAVSGGFRSKDKSEKLSNEPLRDDVVGRQSGDCGANAQVLSIWHSFGDKEYPKVQVGSLVVEGSLLTSMSWSFWSLHSEHSIIGPR
jgi:hypothetical protein